MLSVNADTMSREHHAFVVFFGMCDIPVLTHLAEAIVNEEVIIYRHDTNVIRGLFGDVLSVTAAEGQEPEGKRLCFGRDDCSFNQAGLLFKELDILNSSQLQNYGILNAAAFLIRMVRALQLVTFNSEISLNGGDILLFKMTSSGILGFHQGNAIRYNSIDDTLELYGDPS